MATEYISFTADSSVKTLLQNAAAQSGLSVSTYIRNTMHKASARKLGLDVPKFPRKKAAK